MDAPFETALRPSSGEDAEIVAFSNPHAEERNEGRVSKLVSALESDFEALREALRARLYLAASHSYRGDDRARIEALAQLARRVGLGLVATNDVLYHAPHRRPLQDVLTCIREKCTIDEAGFRLEANAERHLKPPREMARLFKGHEDALERTIEIAQACTFSLDELRYEYPDEPVPAGKTPQSHLADLTWEGAAWRFPERHPREGARHARQELALIEELDYAPYFLTVHDIVHYARGLGILCQGRGSAANSAVCYCLGITNVDPTEIDLLFERFVSPERKEPPDIDVDFEHERREEVIQYIYARYGRDRAGIAATVISYRGRSAVREVGKALGLSEDTVAALATTIWGLSNAGLPDEYVRQAGLDPKDPLLAACLELTQELIGFPRHLSQHVGGFVLTRGPLSEVVPIGNAAMEDRTFIEWDKDDLDALGLLKVDVLGLGMLTCIRKAFALLKAHYGADFGLGTVPRDDPARLRHALPGRLDRRVPGREPGADEHAAAAQTAGLLRSRHRGRHRAPRTDPGRHGSPLSAPPLGRRAGRFPLASSRPRPSRRASPSARQDHGRAAVPGAGDAPRHGGSEVLRAEANELRRAMATFRRSGTIERLHQKMVGRMTARGYPAEFAERCFNQIKGFGEYGFPESHAASFAHLVYVSAWIKCHYPAAFAAALLNSQPMGFYAPAQIVRCAREHGVEARETDVNACLWDCTLEPASQGTFALRIGLRQIDGLREEDVKRLVSVRDGIPAELNPHLFCPQPLPLSSPGLTGRSSNHETLSDEDRELLDARFRGHDKEEAKGRFTDIRDLWRRSGVGRACLEKLAGADAFRSLGLDRRQALWEVRGLPREIPLPLFDHADAAEAGTEEEVTLPIMPLSEHVVNDYRTLRLSLKAHPMSFLRKRVRKARIAACADLKQTHDGARVSVAGVVLVRQRPGSAQGVVFMTIEDETGIANSVIWPKVLERERKVVMGARLVVVHGRVQRHEDIIHVVAERLEDRSDWLRLLTEDGESLSLALANADEVKRPDPGSWRSSREEEASLPLAPADHVKRPLPSRERFHPRWHPRRHPRSERIIPKSRDFH